MNVTETALCNLYIDITRCSWFLAAIRGPLLPPSREYPLPIQALLKQFRQDGRGTLGRALIRSSLGVSGILSLDAVLGIVVAIVLARSLGAAGLGDTRRRRGLWRV